MAMLSQAGVPLAWNNGKSGAKLDLTSSTTPGLQIHKFDHTRTANPCDWLPCRRAALLLVGCPHSLVYLHLPVVEGLIFCISATPHLGTSFPLFHARATTNLTILRRTVRIKFYLTAFVTLVTVTTKRLVMWKL